MAKIAIPSYRVNFLLWIFHISLLCGVRYTWANEVAQTWEAVEKIRELGDWDTSLSYFYLTKLSRVRDKKCVQILLDCLEEWPPLYQHYVIIALGEIKNPQAIGKLIKIVEEGNHWWTRSVAVEALARIGNLCVIPTLITALDDEDVTVRKKSLVGLNKLIEIEQEFSAKKNEQHKKALEFWKNWAQKNQERYVHLAIPKEDFVYYSSMHGFTIQRPSALWRLQANVKKDKSILYSLEYAQQEISVLVWGEKNPLPNEPPKKHFATIIEKRKEEIENFKEIRWKPYKADKRAHYFSYTGNSEGKSKSYYMNFTFFTQETLYHLLLLVPLKNKKKGVASLVKILKNFEIDPQLQK